MGFLLSALFLVSDGPDMHKPDHVLDPLCFQHEGLPARLSGKVVDENVFGSDTFYVNADVAEAVEQGPKPVFRPEGPRRRWFEPRIVVHLSGVLQCLVVPIDDGSVKEELAQEDYVRRRPFHEDPLFHPSSVFHHLLGIIVSIDGFPYQVDSMSFSEKGLKFVDRHWLVLVVLFACCLTVGADYRPRNPLASGQKRLLSLTEEDEEREDELWVSLANLERAALSTISTQKTQSVHPTAFVG